MADLRELQKKLDSSRALKDIVQAMRNLAAIYVRRAEATLDAIRPYSDVTATALDVVLGRMGASTADTGNESATAILAFTSDQGLCGAYNERVVRTVEQERDKLGAGSRVFVIGQRGRDLLGMRGVEPALALSSPSSIEGIRARMPQLAMDVFRAYMDTGAGRLVFVYNAYEGMGRYGETVRPVLPPERSRLETRSDIVFRTEPLLTAAPEELLGPLIEEYFYIELYRAVLESHASENGARLLAMTAASSNIDERLQDLTRDYQTVRQDVITSELLDVVGGAEALR